MKKSLRCFILFLIFCTNIKAQRIEILYEIDFRPSVSSAERERELSILQIDTEKLTSTYKSFGNYQVDSINYVVANKPPTETRNFVETLGKFTPQKSSFGFTVIKNLKNFDLSLLQKVNYLSYKLVSKFPYENWRISNNLNKKISGYSTQAATIQFGGRDWVAYFTSEIPLSDGPYKFHGLPGVILELESADGDYVFKAISIKKLKASPFFSASNSINISEKQYEKLIENYKLNPAGQIKIRRKSSNMSSSVNFDGVKSDMDSDDLIRRIEKEFKDWAASHNNFIEKNVFWINN